MFSVEVYQNHYLILHLVRRAHHLGGLLNHQALQVLSHFLVIQVASQMGELHSVSLCDSEYLELNLQDFQFDQYHLL
jgi:hypothetical protein